MKKIIAYSFNLLFLVTFLASCLGDLDTMPLDNNQLVSDQVYKTKDGYTGVLAKCLASCSEDSISPDRTAGWRWRQWRPGRCQ